MWALTGGFQPKPHRGLQRLGNSAVTIRAGMLLGGARWELAAPQKARPGLCKAARRTWD